MTGPDGAHPHPHAVARVLDAVASAHPDLPEPVVRGVVLDAAGELAGAVPADFPRLLRLRSTARLAAMTGAPLVIATAGARWAPAW